MARGGRTSLSKPCSRIMARTHCSNYSCIRLTPLSAEPAGRGTCVTNVRARPRHRRMCLYAYVLVCVRVCAQRNGRKNKPHQGTTLVERVAREKKSNARAHIVPHLQVHVRTHTHERKVLERACVRDERTLRGYKACQPDTMPAIWRSINELMRYHW